MERVTFNGHWFVKDKKTGYYLSSHKIGQVRKRLHVYVWEFHNGPVPNGYHVHHLDQNKDNNDINNLVILEAHTHETLHANTITEEQKERMRINLKENARPAATLWHKSQAGRKWHSKHGKETWRSRKPINKKCVVCGNEFEDITRREECRFCSNKCKSKYRRDIGVDNIQANCPVCGKEFTRSKYSKSKTCSTSCGWSLRNMVKATEKKKQ